MGCSWVVAAIDEALDRGKYDAYAKRQITVVLESVEVVSICWLGMSRRQLNIPNVLGVAGEKGCAIMRPVQPVADCLDVAGLRARNVVPPLIMLDVGVFERLLAAAVAGLSRGSHNSL
jgi:hypothetical protein